MESIEYQETKMEEYEFVAYLSTVGTYDPLKDDQVDTSNQAEWLFRLLQEGKPLWNKSMTFVYPDLWKLLDTPEYRFTGILPKFAEDALTQAAEYLCMDLDKRFGSLKITERHPASHDFGNGLTINGIITMEQI